MTARPVIGLLDVHDTSATWQRRRLDPLVATRGLATRQPGPSLRASSPPPCTIVVSDYLDPGPFVRLAPWLAAAAKLIVIRRLEPDDEALEPELAATIDEDWDAATRGLPRLARLDWRGGPAGAAAVLDQALALAREFAATPACPAWPADPPSPPARPRLRPTAWLPAPTLEPRELAPIRVGNLAHDGRDLYLVDGDGVVARVGVDRPAPRLRTWPRTAAQFGSDGPHGARRLLAGAGGQVRLLDEAGRPLASLAAPHRHPIGLADAGPWAWIGSRCTFEWLWTGDDALARICVDAREWPCGHAKKLYGYEDNEPEWITVDPTGACVLSVFEHDALIADGVPLRWTTHALDGLGPAPLALLGWPPPADPLRALLFESSAEHRAIHAATPEDEDARIASPAVVLGPHADLRYAVGLTRETWRLRGDVAEPIGGPDQGFAVFDADHRLGRRGRGRLLGGAGELVFVEDHGALWREQLETGARELIGPSAVPIARALPVPGADNLVLIASDGRLRLI